MTVAIVTGAGSGIGRAVSVKLSELGHTVVLVGRTKATLEAVAAEIGKTGETLVAPADVSKPHEVQEIIRQAVAAFGRVDVLVNNAGYAPNVGLAALSVEQWREIMDINLSASFYATKAVWPVMARQHAEHLATHRTSGVRVGEMDRKVSTGGVIVNISSMAARDPFPGLGAYAIAKLGVNMLTKVTAREGAEQGIRAYAVAPAGVETGMFRSLATEQEVPHSEILEPEEVAEVVGACAGGALWNMNGEVVWVHRRV